MHSTNPKTPASCVSSPNVANADRPGVRLSQPVVDRREQVGLADAEPAVEVDANPGQHLALAEQLLLARPPRDRAVAEPQTRRHGRGLRRLGRIGTVACRSRRSRTSAAGRARRRAAPG